MCDKKYLVAYEMNSLKILWTYEICCNILDFKIMYNDIFFKEDTIFKKLNKNNGSLLSSIELENLITFEVCRDSNIYLLYVDKVSMLEPIL